MPNYPIDNTEGLAHDDRVAQARSFVAQSKTFLARGTQTTAQNTAQIRLLTQAVMVLVEDRFNEK